MMIRLGAVAIEIGADRTITTLPNGATVIADHAEQEGQGELATQIGYASAQAMNRDHDLTHSIVAHALGLDCSPTLLGVAMGKTYPHWHIEEAAVLAVQRYANALGVDLIELTQSHG